MSTAIHHEFLLNHACVFHHLRVYERADCLGSLTFLSRDVLVFISAHLLDALRHLGKADARHEGVTESSLSYFGLECLFAVC